MQTTVGIQSHRTAGWRLPPGAVLVSRTSRWGNPFTVDSILAAGHAATKGEARAIAVRRHEAWLDGEGPDTYRISSRLQVSRARVNDQIGQLTGRVLACPCPVDELLCTMRVAWRSRSRRSMLAGSKRQNRKRLLGRVAAVGAEPTASSFHGGRASGGSSKRPEWKADSGGRLRTCDDRARPGGHARFLGLPSAFRPRPGSEPSSG